MKRTSATPAKRKTPAASAGTTSAKRKEPAPTPSAKRARPASAATSAGRTGATASVRQRRAVSTAGTTSNSILEAALVVFARDGFDGASLPGIARAAGIGHPLIHYHFGSKENLWRAAADYAFGELHRSIALLEDASSGMDPLAVLMLLVRGFAQFAARHPSHTLIILGEVRSGGERFEWLVERHLRPLHERLDRVIDAAVAGGQIRPIPAVHLAGIVVGAIAHFFGAAPLMARLYSVDVYATDVIEDHTRWVLDVLMRGLATAPADGSTATGRAARTRGAKAAAR